MCEVKKYISVQTGEELDLDKVVELKDNSMLKVNPHLWVEWDFEKNVGIDIYKLTKASAKKVWWEGICNHKWDTTISIRNNGSGCPYCTGRKILRGFNDLWTTNPELATALVDTEIGFNYTKNSTKKVDWKCPKCQTLLKNRSIVNSNAQGLSCEICKDNLSFSEKMMYMLLRNNNIEFDFDKTTNFSGSRRYDFIIEKIVIEMHGRQHYEDTGFHALNGKTKEKEIENDNIKKNLAEKNGYKYIAIDCRNSDFSYIKNNILNSELKELLNLNEESFDDIDMSNSLVLECWELWNSKGLTKTEIAKELNIGIGKVYRSISIVEQTKIVV